MNSTAPTSNASDAVAREENRARWLVRGAQILFLVVALLDLNGPFVSAHNERQNQTFGMAQHVFRDGWSSVLTPKVSYTLPGYETNRTTAVLQEFPMHGVIGWPFVKVFGHERAVARLVSIAFALISIQVMFLILRRWVRPTTAAIGAVIWATAPLVLQFGMAPMPDIICTTGALAAFLFALRGKLPTSSACFLFALLAKSNIIVFGLPILVALLVARYPRNTASGIKLALLWGWAPLVGLMGWIILAASFGPPTPMSMLEITRAHGQWSTLVHPDFSFFVMGCLVAFGLGVVGILGFALAGGGGMRMDPWIKWALVVSNVVYIIFIIRKIPEPQYLLSLVAWCVIPASMGIQNMIDVTRKHRSWRPAIVAMIGAHILVAAYFAYDAKASRVPDFPDIEKAATLLDKDARVIVFYRYYGASPAVWLDRNVFALGQLGGLEDNWAQLHTLGFNYILLLDMGSRHSQPGIQGPAMVVARLWRSLSGKPPEGLPVVTSFTDANSPERQYCDDRFVNLMTARHLALYQIPANAKP